MGLLHKTAPAVHLLTFPSHVGLFPRRDSSSRVMLLAVCEYGWAVGLSVAHARVA